MKIKSVENSTGADFKRIKKKKKNIIIANHQSRLLDIHFCALFLIDKTYNYICVLICNYKSKQLLIDHVIIRINVHICLSSLAMRKSV